VKVGKVDSFTGRVKFSSHDTKPPIPVALTLLGTCYAMQHIHSQA